MRLRTILIIRSERGWPKKDAGDGGEIAVMFFSTMQGHGSLGLGVKPTKMTAVDTGRHSFPRRSARGRIAACVVVQSTARQEKVCQLAGGAAC